MVEVSKENKELEKVLYDISIEYIKNKDVECIYFTPYVYNEINKYELVVVSNNVDTEFKNKIADLNKELSNKNNEVGGKIILAADDSKEYSTIAMHSYEVRRLRDLISSTILFDRTGKYHKIVDQCKNYESLSIYDNILDIDVNETIKKLNMK